VDDVVDASPVHLGCGAWGLIAVGLFASPNYVGGSEFYGVVYGGNPVQLGIQVLGMVVILSWSGVITGD
jgi:Amt family ammonium transporter